MLRRIKYFQAVVRCHSFTEAAAECFVSQSAISQQVRSLEKELGVSLLSRENRHFSLTPAGEYFYTQSLSDSGTGKHLQGNQQNGSFPRIISA